MNDDERGSAPASFRSVDEGSVVSLVAMMDATDRWTAVRDARSWVLGRGGPAAAGPVLDVGCGPGSFGAQARQLGRSTIDVDRSLGMLHALRGRHRGAAAVAVDVAALPLPDGAAGLVHCERVLQWCPDPGRALAELWRVTTPGGLLAVTDTDWGSFTVTPGAHEAWRAAALGWVPHPRLAASLPERLRALGATDVEVRVDRALVVGWDPEDPAQRDGPPGLPLHSIAAGAPPEAHAELRRSLATMADAARDGAFRATLDLVSVSARR